MSTEIFQAIESHELPWLTKLLEKGADPNVRQPSYPKFTAIQAAINELENGGSIKALEALLSYGADVDMWDEDRDATPLLMALFRNQLKAAKLMLAAGADTNVRGSEGDSPLCWVVSKRDLMMAKQLLEHGAAKTIDTVGGKEGMTALGLASHNLDVPMVELLLNAGANPDEKDENLKTPVDQMPALTQETTEAWNRIYELLSG